MTNQRGQAIIELCLSCSLAISIFVLFLNLCYFGICKLWISFQLYESLMCLATQAPHVQCQKQITHNIDTLLTIGHIEHLSLHRNTHSLQGHCIFQMNSFLKIEERIYLSLPLKD